ncbi:MAG TPA: hypothetical protein VNM39_19685 [Verrucomicrobiae bacterium]|jgi:hypothetical protein|nr:hypothetical protein [Verrucomicrobiae bacterium]
MKRLHSVLLFTWVGVVVLGAPAQAGLCVPQTAFACTSLQSHFNALGESIDVLTQQEEGLVWSTSVSSNATMSIMFQLAGNPNQDEFGIVGLSPAGSRSGLCAVFPANAFSTGYFAVASFRSGGVLTVNLFDASATVINTTTYAGVDRSRFMYYVKNSAGTFFSHMGYNSDGKVHSLVFAGSNMARGSWWMAWEDSMTPSAGADFGDGLVFLGALNPTPVRHATWASVKARFR